MKKKSSLILLAVSIPVAAILSLRAYYSLSLFGGLTTQLRNDGWVSPSADPVLVPHEETTYEASYMFLNIGTASFELLDKTEYDGKPAYRIIARIDSYSGIPFVNYHAVYETYTDARSLTCLHSFNLQKHGDDWTRTTYDFDFANKKIIWAQSRDGRVLRQDILPLDHAYTDGLSFYYYVRRACLKSGGETESLNIPIISDTVMSSVDMTINEKREPCKVPASGLPVDSYRMSGHINFHGTFGVTGNFVGWISADSAEVPLRGNLQVILGNIVVKLTGIKGRNWTPPECR